MYITLRPDIISSLMKSEIICWNQSHFVLGLKFVYVGQPNMWLYREVIVSFHMFTKRPVYFFTCHLISANQLLATAWWTQEKATDLHIQLLAGMKTSIFLLQCMYINPCSEKGLFYSMFYPLLDSKAAGNTITGTKPCKLFVRQPARFESHCYIHTSLSSITRRSLHNVCQKCNVIIWHRRVLLWYY